MHIKFILRLILLSFFLSGSVAAQNQDTIARHKRQKALFSDREELSSSDYLASIEKAGDILNTAKSEAKFDSKTMFTFGELKRTKEALALILNNIEGENNTNVRNQQMYKKVLLELQEELVAHRTVLEANDKKLVQIRKNARSVMKDTVFRKLIRDTLTLKEFKPELLELKAKWLCVDSLLKKNNAKLNRVMSETTEKKMAISEALVLVNDRLDRSGISMFGNEYSMLWRTDKKGKAKISENYLQEKFSIETKAFRYYLSYTVGSTIFLLLFMGLLLWWIRYNLSFLKKAGRHETLEEFSFKYLNRGAFFPVCIIILNIAISSNLYAPALYIEFLHLILLGVMTYVFKDIWSKNAFRNWMLLVVLFVLFGFFDLFLKVSLVQRIGFIVVNLLSIRFGILQLRSIKEEMYIQGFFRWANLIFISFNILAVFFNLFGRVSLAHTLSLTAVISLTQIIALSVFLKIILEIITLQIYTIRVRRGIEKIFDFDSIADNLKMPFLLVITYLWIVVIASNLNLTDSLHEFISYAFNKKIIVGDFSFTAGNILLLVVIIWAAHVLQKYVAYFFGEIDEENEETINKRQHSKLLVTRLTVLILGYLLAISASGMPLDKITIVLGALGVGVGLGLQNIVSNFVSGVILIFDKPIQIGDVIEVSSQSGRVKTIGLRTTKIDTANGAEVIIPNGNMLSQSIVNWTDTNNHKLVDLTFTISGTISQEEITEVIASGLNTIPFVFTDKEPQLFYQSIAEDKYKLKVLFWCNIYKTDQAISEARVVLYEGFKKRGVVFND